MLSHRGVATASQLDVPWRFAPAGAVLYDSEANPSGIISFATAENLLVQRELEEFVKNVHIPGNAFTYRYSTAGGPRLPQILAGFLNEHFSPCRALKGEEVLVTAGATALDEMLAFSLADPGEGILTTRPCYGRFELDFGNKAQLHMVYPDTEAESCFDAAVTSKLEEALLKSNAAGVRIRALLIVNPHNPLGRCYPRETLTALMQFCQRHHIHLISDEIYGLSVFESGDKGTTPFTSALSIDPRGLIDENLLHVTYGMSKDFGSAGLRIGAVITKSPHLRKAMKSIMRFHAPSGPSIAIATALLEDREWCRLFLKKSRQRIARAYQHITSGLRSMGIQYLHGTNAGFFVWVDLSPYLPPKGSFESGQEREFRLTQKLVDAGIFLHPGEEHSLSPGWFRMVYTQPPATVSIGLERLKAAIDNIDWQTT